MIKLKTIAVSLVASMAFSIGTASAAYIQDPFNIHNLSKYEDSSNNSDPYDFINLADGDYSLVTDLTNLLNQTFDLTYLGSEAAFTDKFVSLSGFFNNQSSTIGNTLSNVDFNLAHYTVNNNAPVNFASSHIKVYQLNTQWDIANNEWNGNKYSAYQNVSPLEVGSYIIGFGDSFGDGDFDDLIISAKAVSEVPLPAAVWLFGTGLIGLVGFRRRVLNSKNM